MAALSGAFARHEDKASLYAVEFEGKAPLRSQWCTQRTIIPQKTCTAYTQHEPVQHQGTNMKEEQNDK